MAEAAAREFLTKLKADPALREALSDQIGKGALESALSFAAGKGHDFSHEELVAAYAHELQERGYSKQDIDDLSAAASDPGAYHHLHGRYAKVSAPY